MIRALIRPGFWGMACAGLLAVLLTPTARARVAINEVMYHPPGDRDDLQWVELFNGGTEPVDLSGWTLRKGLRFAFPKSQLLAPSAFVVVARDRVAFIIRYGTNLPVVGDFEGRLRHGGERIELADASGALVDAVQFDDAEPWPLSPDGGSASLERIVAEGPGDKAENWAPSPMPERQRAGGTPGRTNAAAATNLPPVVQDVRFTPPKPGEPFALSAVVSDPDGVQGVQLRYQVIPGVDPAGRARGNPPAEVALPMTLSSGDRRHGTYSAGLPAQENGRLIRFRIEARDSAGSTRFQPHPEDLRPTWSCYIGTNSNNARIPFAFLWQFGASERMGPSIRNMPMGPRGRPANEGPAPARGQAALVYVPPNGGPIQVFDHIRITPRQGGWKVRLHKDRLLDGMSTVNVIFEGQPRYVLSEHLAYELYRAAGVPAPQSGHWRVWFNGQPMAYHLVVEQPNSTFLRRNGRDADGSLYKLLWYGDGIVGQHEKKNHPETGHAQLVDVIESLQRSTGEAQWRLIQDRINVDEFANYYAVNMCLQNWDGFFNNYFVYRGPGASGKWEIFPWDEDKTWGDHDGASPNYDWYSMPLTFGMAGDQPRSAGFLSRFNGGPFGGAPWWRPPGWFSGPLLANPQFRARFSSRLKELCETVFTPQQMEGPIARMEQALEPEIRFRANTRGGRRGDDMRPEFGVSADRGEAPAGNPEPALGQFHRQIESFRRQVTNRRSFILKELEQAK